MTPHTKFLRKLVQGQFSTSKRMEEAQGLRAAEFAHLVRSIPTAGPVSVKFHIEVLIGNIFSQLVLSKRLLQPASYEEAVSSAKPGVGDAEKLRDLMTMTADIDRCIGTFNAGDFIPACKSWDVQGLEGRFQRFRQKMDAFVAVIIHERLTARAAAGAAYESKDYLDALLDEVDQKNNEIDLTTVRSMIWVRKCSPPKYLKTLKVNPGVVRLVVLESEIHSLRKRVLAMNSLNNRLGG